MVSSIKDLIVVGCGIIGATVAKSMVEQGRDVLVLDDQRPIGGTGPSGGHLKPSWFGGMKKTDYEPAMELLDDTWGLEEEQFRIWPTSATVTVYRVDTDQVVQYPRTVDTVVGLQHLNNYPLVKTVKGEYRCRLLVVATGVWAADLIPGVKVVAKQGVSFRLQGKLQNNQGLIKPWAPFKQVVAHQQSPNEIWVGDGSTIIPTNWTKERTGDCLRRCQHAVKGLDWLVSKTLHGLRPYCETEGTDPCLLRKIGPRAWLATGAGKSGTIAAGWVARRLLDATS